MRSELFVFHYLKNERVNVAKLNFVIVCDGFVIVYFISFHFISFHFISFRLWFGLFFGGGARGEYKVVA